MSYTNQRNNVISHKRGPFAILLHFLWICFKWFLVFLILRLLLFGVIKTTNIATETRINLNNIPSPVQKSTVGSVKKKINGEDVKITFVSEYVINGRVVDVERYLGTSVKDQLSTKDVGLAWGILSTDQSQEKLKWSSMKNRLLSYSVNDNAWFQQIGGKSVITSIYSNNHLIPSNNTIASYINTITKGDYVQIEGYLVNVEYEYPKGNNLKWITSTSRSDIGKNSSEIIYVTGVKWLR